MTPEKRVQNKIINYLKELKEKGELIFFERRQAGGFSYKKGIPDLYMVYEGLHIEIEVKKEKNGELSTMQEKFRDMCIKNKIEYICANNFNDFKDYLYYIKEVKLCRKNIK